MSDRPSTNDPGAQSRADHTPEEEAAFEARADTVGRYAGLMEKSAQAERDAVNERYEAARANGASRGELAAMSRKSEDHVRKLFTAVVVAVIVLIAAYFLFFEKGIDTLTGIDGAVSSEIEKIAPPEPADTPEEVLPPQVFTAACTDCGEVTQKPLDLTPEAKYQFAYEAGASRLAIFTVRDVTEYDGLLTWFEDRQQAAENAATPIELEGVGDEAHIFGGSVIFKTSEDCGVISGMPKQGTDGDDYMSLSPEELELLARTAAPRM